MLTKNLLVLWQNVNGYLTINVLTLFTALLLGNGLHLQAETISKEYQVKAIFLIRFLDFIEWPHESFASPDDPIKIGILGEDPFGSTLDTVVSDERSNNRKIKIVRTNVSQELQSCHVVFISSSERDNVQTITTQFAMAAILTISDLDGFAEQGGIIQFYTDKNKIRFEINPAVAQKNHLRLSAQLLALGRLVGGPPSAGGQ